MSSILSDAQFTTILDAVENRCRGIGCGFARRDCREVALERKIDEMVRGGEFGSDFNRHAVIYALNEVLPDYFRTRHQHKRTEDRLAAFRKRIFDRFKQLAAV